MDTHRLFFALWPNHWIRAKVAAAAKSLVDGHRGKAVPADNYHITLAFLGNVTEEQMACALRLGDAMAGEPFEFRLDQLGFFSRAHVVWLGPGSCPPAASLLYGRLQAALPACGLVPETRPFHPHLTLVRKAFHSPASSVPISIRWRVKDFALVESETHSEGSHYRVVRRWPLGNKES